MADHSHNINDPVEPQTEGPCVDWGKTCHVLLLIFILLGWEGKYET